jgi:predicted nucleic acid-binding protein
MNGAYFDVSYLAKLHWKEPGTSEVVALAHTLPTIACSFHGRAEFAAVGYRKVRERAAVLEQAQSVFAQLQQDTYGGGLIWLPLDRRIYEKVEAFFLNDPGSVFLRTSDAIHLVCAAEHGFKEVYSNDRHFLAAAPLFGMRGINVIGKPMT